MKYILFITVSLLLILSNAFAVEKPDSLHKEKLISELKDSLRNLNQANNLLTDKVEKLNHEETSPEGQMESLVYNLKYATYLVDVMVLMVALFSFYIGYIAWSRQKDAEKKMNDFESNAKFKMDKFDRSAEDKLQEVKLISNRILGIEKELKTNQYFIKQGLDGFNDFIYTYLDKNQNTEFLKLLSAKCAVHNLYSFEERDRFSGITTLIDLGNPSDIQHLEYIIKNTDETDINKEIAFRAIVSIKSRSIKEQ